jgi:hypothetical protein
VICAGIDLGNVTTVGFVEVGKTRKKVLGTSQVLLDEKRTAMLAADAGLDPKTMKLLRLQRFLRATLLAQPGVELLTIEEPPLVRNIKVYGILSAYLGVALGVAGNLQQVKRVKTIGVSGWQKALGARISFKKGEHTGTERVKITKQAIAIRVREELGFELPAKEHDRVDAVAIAYSGWLTR